MRNFKLRSIWPVILFGITLACVKDPQDIPSGLTQDPVFGLTGQFGNDYINIDAGIGNWTFAPVVNEADSFHVYSAILSQDGCVNDCPSSWIFDFYQINTQSVDENEIFEQTFQPGPVDFVIADSDRDSFKVSVSTHPDLFMNGVSFWEDPGNPNLIYTNDLHETVGGNEVFDACFQTVVFAGCQYNQCIYFQPATLAPCVVHIEARVENARYIVLSAKPEGTPPYQIQWGDGLTGSSMVVIVQDSVKDIYAQVSVTDAKGNRAELAQIIRLSNGVVDLCYYPINIESVPFTNTNVALAAGDVKIRHLDANGDLWTSTGNVQPAESYCLLSEIGAYGISPFGQPAFKATLSLRVLLKNQMTGESRWFEAPSVVLPLAHP